MAISNLSDFRAYIRRGLGGGNPSNLSTDRPTINVEVSVEQLNQCIEDTILVVQRHLYGEAVYEDFVALSLVPGVSAYNLSGTNIEDVVDFSIGQSFTNGVSVAFSPANMIMGSQFQYLLDGQGMSLVNYTAAMNYIEMIEDTFSIKYRMDFRELQNVLIVTPTPKEFGVGLMKVYKRESAENLYNHPTVKKIAIAKAKQIWGTALSKMGNLPMPGGGSWADFGNRIWDQGREDEKYLVEKLYPITGESEPVGFLIG